MTTLALAFDKATVRTIDRDGRLHIALSNMSKAMVCPYRGAEIPKFAELGLEPDRVYYLLRDPAELEKGADTFNNLPVLSRHVPVTADAPAQDLVIGSTGTDAAYSDPYLQNSAVVWVAQSIEDIEKERAKQWSAAYHYVADMTPGNYQGLRYDGIMRNIVGNHVALVKEGRAGADVVVGDSKLELPAMALKTRKALIVRGALAAHLAPLLAQDAQIDLNPILADVTRKNFAAKKAGIAAAVTTACAGKLAQDAAIGDVIELLDSLTDAVDGEDGDDMIAAPAAAAVEEDKPAVDGDDAVSKIMAFLKGKLSDEDMSAITAMISPGAMDEDEPDADADKGKKKDMPAMDAKTIERNTIARMNAIQTAREAVEPVIGKVSIACDSAGPIYKLALDHLKVDTAGVHPSAYPAMLKLARQKTDAAKPELGMDAATVDAGQAAFARMAPNASKLIRS